MTWFWYAVGFALTALVLGLSCDIRKDAQPAVVLWVVLWPLTWVFALAGALVGLAQSVRRVRRIP